MIYLVYTILYLVFGFATFTLLAFVYRNNKKNLDDIKLVSTDICLLWPFVLFIGIYCFIRFIEPILAELLNKWADKIKGE